MNRFLFDLFIVSSLILLTSSYPTYKPVDGHIMSIWGESMDASNPHPEYPRPQMVRQEWRNLNGLWEYSITRKEEHYNKPDGRILVPFCVESSLSGVGRTVGCDKALWYNMSFKVPSSWRGRKILLHFGAVDWKSEVWINGKRVGEHTGGYTPFKFDITSYLVKDKNQDLLVKVLDATDNSYQPRGKQAECPCTIWYTSVTGIWQTVWLESVPETYIDSYFTIYDNETGNLRITVKTENQKENDSVVVRLLEGALGYSAEKPSKGVMFESKVQDGTTNIHFDHPELWSPDRPWLYGLELNIMREGKVIDSVNGYCALRTVGQVSDPKPDRNTNSFKRIALNGERTFFFGPLDQGWWPDGLYTAPSEDAMKFDLEKIKQWGWNMVRKHVKVEPARWYYWCDVLGLTVWQDMPNIGDHDKRTPVETRSAEVVHNTRGKWGRDYLTFAQENYACPLPQEAKSNYYKEWGEIIDAVKFFPCITVWTPFNEAWGQFDTPDVVSFTRNKDGSRLINEASGGNFTFSGDILAPHHYASPAMHALSAAYINVLAEYGGLGLQIPGHVWKDDSGFYYGKVFTSGEDVMNMYEHFAEMLKPMIVNGCSAAVYTELTDVEIEVNGIMTYDRKVVKLDEERLTRINKELVESFK